MLRPILIESALARRHESVESACNWVWFHGATHADRAEVDAWLLHQKHPLTFQPGTAEYRFKAIVRELREQRTCRHDGSECDPYCAGGQCMTPAEAEQYATATDCY